MKWTEEEEKEYVKRLKKYKGQLRRVTKFSPKFYEAKILQRSPYDGPNKRQKWKYQCNICKCWFMEKEMEYDHIIPCGSLLSRDDERRCLLELIIGSLQMLCVPCHRSKTNKENADRRKKKCEKKL